MRECRVRYIVPISGSRNPARVAQNIAADLDRIAEITPKGGIGGRLS